MMPVETGAGAYVVNLGAVGSVFISFLNQTLPEWPEILINWGLAILFTMRTWRLWREGLLFTKSGGEYAGKP